MNRKIATVLLIAAAAVGNAFAETPTVDNTAFNSSLSRAQVQTQLGQYKQAGVNPWSQGYNPLRSFKSEKTREAVAREYIASRGQVAALTGEDSGSAYLARSRSVDASTTLAGHPATAL